MENNLTELNAMLFETFRDLKEDKIEPKKATGLTNVANTIINNTKLQLAVYKLTSGNAYQDIFVRPTKTLMSTDVYEQKSEFSIFKGFKSVAAAMGKMGNANFENEFKTWIRSAV